MNWSLFLLNQLLQNSLTAQAGQPFSYSWLLILIAPITWMEPEDYQPMEIDVAKVHRGARYQNLWWIEEPSQQVDCAIHFWVYWEALQAIAIVVPRISPYASAKYQQLIRFAIGPHSIYIQERRDPDQQWLPLDYKVMMKELDAIVQEWSAKWHNPVSEEKLFKEPPPDAPEGAEYS